MKLARYAGRFGTFTALPLLGMRGQLVPFYDGKVVPNAIGVPEYVDQC